jgi:HEAT repeat protein
MGPRAAPAVPQLVAELEAESRLVRLEAALVLARIGPVAAPDATRPLAALLDAADPYLAEAALQAFVCIDPEAVPVAGGWRARARQREGEAGGTFVPRSTHVRMAMGVNCLREALYAGDPRMRASAVLPLAAWRERASGALSHLRMLVGDADPTVRQRAVVAIDRIVPLDGELPVEVLGAAEDRHPAVRVAVIRVADRRALAAPLLERALADAHPAVRRVAAVAARRVIGDLEGGVRVRLQGLRTDADPTVRAEAELALRERAPREPD